MQSCERKTREGPRRIKHIEDGPRENAEPFAVNLQWAWIQTDRQCEREKEREREQEKVGLRHALSRRRYHRPHAPFALSPRQRLLRHSLRNVSSSVTSTRERIKHHRAAVRQRLGEKQSLLATRASIPAHDRLASHPLRAPSIYQNVLFTFTLWHQAGMELLPPSWPHFVLLRGSCICKRKIPPIKSMSVKVFCRVVLSIPAYWIDPAAPNCIIYTS